MLLASSSSLLTQTSSLVSLRSTFKHRSQRLSLFKDWFGGNDSDNTDSKSNFITKSDLENDLSDLKTDFKEALSAYQSLYDHLDKKITYFVEKEKEETEEREKFKTTLLKSVDEITKFLQDIDKIYDKIKENNNKIIQEKIQEIETKIASNDSNAGIKALQDKIQQLESKIVSLDSNISNIKVSNGNNNNELIDNKLADLKKEIEQKLQEKVTSSLKPKATKPKAEPKEPKIEDDISKFKNEEDKKPKPKRITLKKKKEVENLI